MQAEIDLICTFKKIKGAKIAPLVLTKNANVIDRNDRKVSFYYNKGRRKVDMRFARKKQRICDFANPLLLVIPSPRDAHSRCICPG